MADTAAAWLSKLREYIPRLCITGGSGFIGTNAVAFALDAGVKVLSLDIAEPRCAPHRAVWNRCDVLDRGATRKAFAAFQPTHVLHLAARTDLREKKDLGGYAANTRGLSNLIDALSNSPCKRAIFASSMLVCRNGHRPSTDTEYCPDTLYGESKAHGERIVRAAGLQYVWSIVRPTSIWGPWFGPPYSAFFESVARGIYCHPGSGAVHKALGFVGNTVWQLYKVLTAPAEAVQGRMFYVTDYEQITIAEWASMIAAACGTAPVTQVPVTLMRLAAFAGDCAQFLGLRNPPLTSFRLRNMLTPSAFDCAPLKEISGPLPFTVVEGVKTTVAWLAAQSSGAKERVSSVCASS